MQEVYYVFADESRDKRPTCLGYATGPTPLGPFTYRGVIIDNNGCDPGVWNDHGRIVEFQRHWYVFYHRSILGDRRPRQICAEPISFTADGLIPEVKMTSQGIGPPLDVCRQTAASLACRLSGTVRVDIGGDGGLCLGKIQDGDTALYRGVRFGAKPKVFRARCLVLSVAGTLEVRLDSPANDPIAVLPIPAYSMLVTHMESNAPETWQTLSIPLHSTVPGKGVHDLYLSFHGGAPASLQWFQFDP